MRGGVPRPASAARRRGHQEARAVYDCCVVCVVVLVLVVSAVVCILLMLMSVVVVVVGVGFGLVDGDGFGLTFMQAGLQLLFF